MEQAGEGRGGWSRLGRGGEGGAGWLSASAPEALWGGGAASPPTWRDTLLGGVQNCSLPVLSF